MNTNQAFPSKYLKAADVEDTSPIVTIEEVRMETVGQGAQQNLKPVVYFRNAKKAMVLNKTNANTIAKIAGTQEMDEWPGTKIRLIAASVEFQGEEVQAIRVRDPKIKKAAPEPVRPEPVDLDTEPDDSDVPF